MIDILTLSLLGLLLKELHEYGKHTNADTSASHNTAIPVAEQITYKPDTTCNVRCNSNPDFAPSSSDKRYDVLAKLDYTDFVDCVRIMDSETVSKLEESSRRSREDSKLAKLDNHGREDCRMQAGRDEGVSGHGPDQDLCGKTVEYYFPRVRDVE
jgi:hypothetical protein